MPSDVRRPPPVSAARFGEKRGGEETGIKGRAEMAGKTVKLRWRGGR
jgi:hypothetical protein